MFVFDRECNIYFICVLFVSWIKVLWSEKIIPCVEESVRQRTVAATETQRDMLIKATLKALFEKSIRAGCPVDLRF